MADISQCMTLWERVLYWSQREPDRDAYVFRSPTVGRTTLTRSDLKHMSHVFAGRIARAGLQQGDVVCNTLQNSPERVVTDLGIMAAGTVLLDKRVFLRDATDLMHMLNKSQARMLIVDPGEKPQAGGPSAWDIIRSKCSSVGDLDLTTGTVTVTWPEVASLERVMYCPRGEKGTEFEYLQTLKDAGAEEELNPKVHSSDVAVLFPTSASTGLPKLTVYTHGNIVIEADIFRELFSLQEEDIIFQDRPVGWIAAFHLPYLATGAPRIMTDGRTQLSETYIDAIWATIAEEKVTLAHLTPQTVARLLALPDLLEQHPSQPRSILMTGQPLRKRFAAVIGTLSRTMFTSYGLTECGYITSGLCRTADDFDDCLVGRSSASTEVRIVDENLKPLPPGKTGEVLARSKSRFMGYFRDEEKTKLSMLDDGWVRTDDLGYLDDRGQLYVFGRRSDAIMRGVVIVYPHEIERRLSTISGVHDVMVVGVPDPELFQEICACVVLDPGSTHTAESLKTLSDAINAQTTEDLPISPKYFLLFDAALPTTATGKVSRKLLQQEATKRLGLQN